MYVTIELLDEIERVLNLLLEDLLKHKVTYYRGEPVTDKENELVHYGIRKAQEVYSNYFLHTKIALSSGGDRE